jgi:Arc/MetJ-type ribon-helix-helix transcriptional regulator
MSDSEKITINMSAVDLGKVDLLVQEGLFSNRTDFIRTAIRNLLDKHSLEIQQSVTRHSYGIGIFDYSRKEFEKHQVKGEKVKFSVVGMLIFADDISPELALDVVESIQVRGIFRASEQVKAVLVDRMKTSITISD